MNVLNYVKKDNFQFRSDIGEGEEFRLVANILHCTKMNFLKANQVNGNYVIMKPFKQRTTTTSMLE